MKIKSPLRFSLLGMALFALGIAPAFAQSGQATGKLKIHVSPKQAYVLWMVKRFATAARPSS